MATVKRFLLLLFTSSVWAFEESPWFSEPYLFEFRPAFTWGYFSEVEGGSESFSSNTQDLVLNLGVATMSNIEAQVDLQFWGSKQKSFNFESMAVQLRYLVLDDLVGDLISLTAGANFRVVPFWRLQDVAMPYHYVSNLEAVVSAGKEFSSGPYWYFHLYGLGAFGWANKGAPWLRFLLEGRYNIQNTHRLSGICRSYIGLGDKRTVDVSNFDGYYDVYHRSIDLAASYYYHFREWGDLGVEGGYRVFARAYPEWNRYIMIEWKVPFSIF